MVGSQALMQNELNCSEGSWGDDASSVAGLGAIGYDHGLDIADQGVRGWRTPQTEVGDIVDKHRLALRRRPLRRGVANVIT
jgi:hypothetical protein